MLILSIVIGLSTMQVDYTATFVHALIDIDVYIQMPQSFAEAGKVLKLNKCSMD